MLTLEVQIEEKLFERPKRNNSLLLLIPKQQVNIIHFIKSTIILKFIMVSDGLFTYVQ